MRSTYRLFFAFLVLLLGSVVALAQTETGEINGTVTDKSGAVVAGATVTATNPATGAARSTVTTGSGSYSITNLRPATYELKVEGKGFQAVTRRVELNVGGHQTADIAMDVATEGTVVEVVAGGGVEVNTQNPELSQVVTENQVKELPTITRNPYDLVATAGNVSQDPSGGNRGVGFNINGQRSASTDILLDGAENTDLFGVGVGQPTPLDSVQEFRVITSNMGPEYGRASGGVVNVATKSGTNALHGTAYEFNRLSTYASNDFDSNARGLPKARFTRNQFGFSVGGPIIKNKLFFFNNTEWTRVRSQANINALVLDPAFIAMTNANTQAFFAAYGTLGSTTKQNGVITQGQVTGYSAALNPNFAALPASTPVFDRVSYTAPADSGGGAPQNSYNSVSRVDFNITDKTTLFGRYTIYREDDFAGFNNNSPYAGYNTGISNFDNNFLGGLTHIFGPSLVSTSKVLFTRFNNLQPLGTVPVSPTLYFSAVSAYNVGGTTTYGPGYSPTTPGSAIPFGGPQNFGELSQDFSWSKGNHQFKFGGQFLYVKDNRVFGAYEEAVQALSATSNIGKGYDRLLAGQLGLLQVAVDPQGHFPCVRNPNGATPPPTPACTITLPVNGPRFDRANRFNDGAAYVNDTWKVLPRFTLDLGVRWEYYGVQHNNNANFDSNFYFGSGATIFDQIRSGSVQLAANSPVGGLWAPRKKNFGPRTGFAWDVFGNGKTSLRGGYGISYERNFNNVTFNVIQNPPNYAVLSFQAPTDAPVVNISTNNYGQFGTGTGTKALPAGSITLRAVDPHIKTAYSEFWDMAVEREVIKNTTVSVQYSGSRGIHLYSIANINRPESGQVYLGDSRFGSRLNQQYGSINFRGSNGDSWYHALNVGFRSNNLLNTGLSITSNYTWAHAIDDLSSTFTDGSANNNNLGYVDPFNPLLDRGNADYDIRHRLNISAVWDLPFAKNSSNSLLKQVIGGWTVAPIFTARTGSPFSAFDCTNTAFAVCSRAIFNTAPQTSSNALTPIAGSPNTYNYLNWPVQTYGQYTDPVSGTDEFPTCTTAAVFGSHAASGCTWPVMSQRNSFRGPSATNLDLGVYKNFKVTERVGLQFRSEFFNVLNHANTFISGNGTNDVSFLPYAQAYKSGRRQIQFALKVNF